MSLPPKDWTMLRIYVSSTGWLLRGETTVWLNMLFCSSSSRCFEVTPVLPNERPLASIAPKESLLVCRPVLCRGTVGSQITSRLSLLPSWREVWFILSLGERMSILPLSRWFCIIGLGAWPLPDRLAPCKGFRFFDLKVRLLPLSPLPTDISRNGGDDIRFE